MARTRCWFYIAAYVCFMVSPGANAHAQGVDVSVKILVQPNYPGTTRHKTLPNSADVVVWLTSLVPETTRAIPVHHAEQLRLIQRGKHFIPHLLVVPTGSSVQFPNQDPFFHNVFSLFDGKRFDLGLYEPGTSRSVRFDREGVSYIFCNIHPEMGAVIISLSTPYYAVSNAAGEVIIHGVPPGSYRLHVWGENSTVIDQAALQKIVQVDNVELREPEIVLRITAVAEQHKNKFGEDYSPLHDRLY